MKPLVTSLALAAGFTALAAGALVDTAAGGFVAAGGAVRIANGCTLRDGFLEDVALPRNPLALMQVALAFPSVPFIVPHFGAGFLREALMLAEGCGNVYLDTSSSNAWMRYLPGVTLQQVFNALLGVEL